METSVIKYGTTAIDHNIRIKLKLTADQYIFLDCIYNFNCKKKNTTTFLDIHKVTGLSETEIGKIFLSLKDTEFLKIKGSIIFTCELWNQNFVNEDLLPEIVAHLNDVLGAKYSATNGETKKHIRARLKEGYTLHDFILVIESRHVDWSEDAHMRQYLRPATLFGTKFESYLQHAIANATKPITSKTNGRDKQKSPTNFESVAGAYRDIPD